MTHRKKKQKRLFLLTGGCFELLISQLINPLNFSFMSKSHFNKAFCITDKYNYNNLTILCEKFMLPQL